MPRQKNRPKFIHQPSTHDIFLSLSTMPSYSKILLENTEGKPYVNLLKGLLDVDFYSSINEKTTIKKISTDFSTDAAKVTKWIAQVYEDILTLNTERPELFQKEGHKVTLIFRFYDNSCMFYTGMNAIPREFERLSFYFVNAKVGSSSYWVKRVEHQIEKGQQEISIWLEAGSPNKYRDFALDKALFQGRIGFMDVYQQEPSEIDEKLKSIYKN